MIVLDSPLLPVTDTLEMPLHVDRLVAWGRERQTTLDQTLAARNARSRFPERPIGVVITGPGPRPSAYDGYAYS